MSQEEPVWYIYQAIYVAINKGGTFQKEREGGVMDYVQTIIGVLSDLWIATQLLHTILMFYVNPQNIHTHKYIIY